MPTRAPTYYHWCQDKPCTTNQVYGFGQKIEETPKKKLGPFDYTRPFSNSAFFPQISGGGSLTTTTAKAQSTLRSCSALPAPRVRNRFDINRGYEAGYIPVTSKILKASLPTGLKLERVVSAPPAVYQYRPPKDKEIYLWHSLSGCLVNVKNRAPESQQAAN